MNISNHRNHGEFQPNFYKSGNEKKGDVIELRNVISALSDPSITQEELVEKHGELKMLSENFSWKQFDKQLIKDFLLMYEPEYQEKIKPLNTKEEFESHREYNKVGLEISSVDQRIFDDNEDSLSTYSEDSDSIASADGGLSGFSSEESTIINTESQPNIFQRKFPQEGSLHRPLKEHQKEIPLFNESEIKTISNIIAEAETPSPYPLKLKRSEHNKTVIQQQARSSYVDTCITMLLADEGKEPNTSMVFLGTTTNASDAHYQFEDQGLSAKEYNLYRGKDKEPMIKSLKKALTNGSLILNIGGEIGGHAIILDHISDNGETARIRDPYHGWEIEITTNALISRNIGKTATYIDLRA